MSLHSMAATGTKLWLDSILPAEVLKNSQRGVTGATSNPSIIEKIIQTGDFDSRITEHVKAGLDDASIAWAMTNELVSEAQKSFLPVWEKTRGDDGFVSFELDPLIEDTDNPIPHDQRIARYKTLAAKWSASQKNRMIKVPATQAGLEALEDIAASGVTINVTLMFSMRQYQAARDAIWRGAQRRKDGLENFKSVYSIFISRVDVYTDKKITTLSDDAQGMVGLLIAKEVWRDNQKFWSDKRTRLRQEIIFASTGKKLDWQDEDFYPAHLVGSDIQTNPPKTLEAIEQHQKPYQRTIDTFPPQKVIDEIKQKVDMTALEKTLMSEGIAKFAKPMRELLERIAQKRKTLGKTSG